MRPKFFVSMAVLLALSGALTVRYHFLLPVFLLLAAVSLVGVHDVTQTKRAILRNYPVVGHLRYLMEKIRPEINQYFIESNTDGMPFNREQRSVVYQRAKRQLDTLPFGTQWDVYAPGYEWIAHSMLAKTASEEVPRVMIGEETCDQPYSAALLNISAMSFGSLSTHAILALNEGARQGGFAHNTGEGGVSPYHLKNGGDLIWQIGTGYFGCRAADGGFDAERFRDTASQSSVRMIEVKLSQGAKPGHGGILPAAKLTEEIAAIRGVPMGQDVLSPPSHSAFRTPTELLNFLQLLRTGSGGKPVGIKLCVGIHSEFMALCKAMQRTGLHPDFIAVDGGEGGTGAAPLEFSNSVGSPLDEGLVFVHNCLVGFALRDKVKIFASGKIATGFQMARRMAMGADVCYSARAMMLALGCIQARTCNTNHCPVGVATQEPGLVAGLVVGDKAARVANFQQGTVHSFLELLGAAGLDDRCDLGPQHVMRRLEHGEVRTYLELFPYIETGALLYDPVPEAYEHAWREATSAKF